MQRPAPGLDRGEQRLPHPVAGRAGADAARRLDAAPAREPADDPGHGFSGSPGEAERSEHSAGVITVYAFSMKPECRDRSISATASASRGARARAGSSSRRASAASRAATIVFSSRRTRRFCRLERNPDCDLPEDVALAALVEVDPAQLEPVGGRRHRVQPLARRGAGLGAGDQQAEPREPAPADPAPELVELGDAEPLGVEEHHRGGVGDVDAHLDHGGRDQDVDLPGGEGAHGRLLLVRRRAARAARRAAARPAAPRPSSSCELLDGGQRPPAAVVSLPSSSMSRWSRSPCSGSSPVIRGQTT